MCGISGIITNNKETFNSIKIADLKRLMKNRGPDHFGFFNYKIKNYSLGLYASRLKILDTSNKSNQPFYYKNYVLIFNGEIYNYLELKKKLKKKNYSFTTSSDTEVLIKSFDCWKEKCVDHLEGMWSFAVLDKKKNKLFLSRDPFGEKPLFYFKDSNNFVFGSEIKFILNIYKKKFLKKINYEKIQDYLYLGHKSLNKDDQTFYSNIKKINSGTNINIDLVNNNFTKKSLLKKKLLTENKVNRFKNFHEYCEKVKSTLEKSIELRLRADVKIAFCLSGGVDSSGLVAIAKKKYGIKPKCYSIIDHDRRYNEEKNINKIERELKIKSKKLYIKKEKNFLTNLKKLIRYHDSPISTVSYYAHSKISKAASSDGYKVILSGTGADEIFSGYYDHHLFNLYEYYKNNKTYFKLEKYYWHKFVRPLVRNKNLRNINYIFSKELGKHIFLNKELSKKYFKFKQLNKPIEKKIFRNKLKNRMANELYEIVPVILHEDDLNSMLYSIENRSPYLDKELVKLSFSAPNYFMIKYGLAKYTLRNVLTQYLPKEILYDRKKIGFNWSLSSLPFKTKKKIFKFLNSDDSLDHLIHKKEVLKLTNKKYLSNSENKILFSILNVKLFLNQINEKQ